MNITSLFYIFSSIKISTLFSSIYENFEFIYQLNIFLMIFLSKYQHSIDSCIKVSTFLYFFDQKNRLCLFYQINQHLLVFSIKISTCIWFLYQDNIDFLIIFVLWKYRVFFLLSIENIVFFYFFSSINITSFFLFCMKISIYFLIFSIQISFSFFFSLFENFEFLYPYYRLV